MTTQVFFTEDGESTLFAADLDAVPRVGDAIEHDMGHIDRRQFNAEALAFFDAAQGKTWRVTSVSHTFRKSSAQGYVHYVTVMLEIA